MKYGDYFERESVPRWSLHNIDYNSLKQQIKLHTTKGQARAIVIPGQADPALQRFEDEFYEELSRQHDRVGVFVSSKTDEIWRRLHHLRGLVRNLILKCVGANGITSRRQRRFAKYQQQIVECGQDIKDLQRFVRAQVEAFWKILKKYKKWTGSSSLTSRFNFAILNNAKSFTNQDLHAVQLECRDVLTTLQASSPGIASPVDRIEASDTMITRHLQNSRHGSQDTSRRSSYTPVPTPPIMASSQEPEIRGWNEYDNGSDAGDESYYIDINPDDSEGFPGMGTVRSVFGTPVKKIRDLFARSYKDAERQSLLNGGSLTPRDYYGVRQSAHTTDNEATEDEDASSVEYPAQGYAAHYAALPSIEEQRVHRFKELVLHRSTILSFLSAIILTIIAGILVATGRHKLRLEVDAGVTLAVVASLFAGCMGLGAMLYRQDKLSLLYQSTIWFAFLAVCLLNGMLLVLVVGSNGI